MCGIFGTIGHGIAPTEALRASQLLRHRGPDDEGYLFVSADALHRYGGPDTPAEVYDSRSASSPEECLQETQYENDAFLMLGHRRLSIVDLTPAGHQPMAYRGRYWMVYNGEVYNYRELRTELESDGYHFSSDTDSEVILAAYQRWGTDCLTKFNGMWALAIYDCETSMLLLARDRFGVKPLYLWNSGDKLHFASEIKAFTASDAWRPRARLDRLLEFLIWNVTDQDSGTFFEGVEQLPAGHYLLLNLKTLGARQGPAAVIEQAARPKRWYDITPGPALTGDAAVAAVHAVLDDAVRLRLRADVIVGSCLSGGLDSSAIVCLMSRQLQSTDSDSAVRTITARSLDSAYDEGGYAGAVIQATRAIATEVTPLPERLFEELDQVIWHQDEPFLTTSIYAQWCVFKAAAEQGLKVMLDGQGADEVFGGYHGFFGAALAGHVRRGALGSWLADLRALKREVGFSAVRSVGYTLAYLLPRAARFLGQFDNRSYSDTDWIRLQHHGAFKRTRSRARSVAGMSLEQIRATNLPMLLHWEDRNSMAHSIEARVPFLDYRLVEAGIGLPDAEKVALGVTKSVVRRAMRGIVPDAVLDRRDKMGFLTAEPLWVRRDMAPEFREQLQAAVAALPTVLTPALVTQFDEVVAGTRSFDFRYWRAIVVGRWVQVFGVEVVT